MGNIQYAIGRPFGPYPQNELTNGDFGSTLGVTLWTATNATVAREASTGAKLDSPDSAKCTITANGDATFYSSDGIRATSMAGKRYSFSAWVKYSGSPIDVSAKLEGLGGAEATEEIATGSQAVTSGTWYLVYGDGVMTENDRTSVKLTITAESAVAAATLNVSRARVWIMDEDGGDFLPPVDSFMISGDNVSGYPCSNASDQRINATARVLVSTGSYGYFVFDMGKAVIPTAVLVEGLNATSVNVSYANIPTDAANYTHETSVTVGQNPYTKRYTRLVAISSGASRRFWAIRIPTANLIKSTDDPELSRVSWVLTVRTMPQNWGTPYRHSLDQLRAANRYPGGYAHDRRISPPFMTFALQQTFDSARGDSVEQDVERYAAMEADERILHFENRDADTNRAKAYICRSAGPVSVDRDQHPILSVSVGLEELS